MVAEQVYGPRPETPAQQIQSLFLEVYLRRPVVAHHLSADSERALQTPYV